MDVQDIPEEFLSLGEEIALVTKQSKQNTEEPSCEVDSGDIALNNDEDITRKGVDIHNSNGTAPVELGGDGQDDDIDDMYEHDLADPGINETARVQHISHSGFVERFQFKTSFDHEIVNGRESGVLPVHVPLGKDTSISASEVPLPSKYLEKYLRNKSKMMLQ